MSNRLLRLLLAAVGGFVGARFLERFLEPYKPSFLPPVATDVASGILFEILLELAIAVSIFLMLVGLLFVISVGGAGIAFIPLATILCPSFAAILSAFGASRRGAFVAGCAVGISLSIYVGAMISRLFNTPEPDSEEEEVGSTSVLIGVSERESKEIHLGCSQVTAMCFGALATTVSVLCATAYVLELGFWMSLAVTSAAAIALVAGVSLVAQETESEWSTP